jgi:hypothetical protein
MVQNENDILRTGFNNSKVIYKRGDNKFKSSGGQDDESDLLYPGIPA